MVNGVPPRRRVNQDQGTSSSSSSSSSPPSSKRLLRLLKKGEGSEMGTRSDDDTHGYEFPTAGEGWAVAYPL